ncbi:hypothetical protein DRO38_04380, partial [Candidatus Bathyarchaeota archaeon]
MDVEGNIKIMERFAYTARDERGNLVKGIMVAEDEIDLANKISHLGYFLTSFKLAQEGAEEQLTAKKMPRLKFKEVLQFT